MAVVIGEFESNITGLLARKDYYVRSYATNSVGTSYGSEKAFLSVCPTNLEGAVTYSNVVTGGAVSIAPCLPSVSGTTQLTSLGGGAYALGDASFGQYDCAYSDNPASGVIWTDNCGDISSSGSDQYGLIFQFSLVSNDGTTLVINWFNDYGDSGTSSLTRVGGWPLGLHFL